MRLKTFAQQLVRKGYTAEEAVELAKRTYSRDTRGRFSGAGASRSGAPAAESHPAGLRGSRYSATGRVRGIVPSVPSAARSYIRNRIYDLTLRTGYADGSKMGKKVERAMRQLGRDATKAYLDRSNKTPEARLVRFMHAMTNSDMVVRRGRRMQVAYEQGGAAALRPYIRTLRTLNRRFKDVAPSFIKLAAKHYRERGNKMPQDWSPFGGAF